MSNNMNAKAGGPHPNRPGRGFALIEVLVAVVILATGLLALAALQTSLIRNSSDSRARSQIAAFVEQVSERQRILGYDGLPASSVYTAAERQAVEAAAGVTNLALSVSGSRYDGRTGDFVACTTCGGLDPARHAEYKTAIVRATWTDATGAARSLEIPTVVGPTYLNNSNTLVTRETSATFSVTPVVRTLAPTNVLPIAVGNNTDTAATNPKPTLGGDLASTSFNVLTYQGSDGGAVRIQQRVETEVVQCTCKKSSTPTFVNDTVLVNSFKYRPTYWDGFQYAGRGNTFKKPDSGPFVPKGQGNNPLYKQSDLCDDCCRDHHDATSDEIKFHNLTSDYNKYAVEVSQVTTGTGNSTVTTLTITPKRQNNDWLVASGTDIYINACRVTRVNGLWQVASDLQSDHMGLLATATASNPATSPQPLGPAAAAYEKFVIDLLGARVRNVVNATALPDRNTLYKSYGLDEPDELTTIGNAKRYLHARGLYVDHLEVPAIKAITNAFNKCTATDKTTCALKHIPFNTINITELGLWDSTNGNVLVVSNASGGDPGDPIRGVVSTRSTGSARADVKMGLSNSSVTSSLAVNPAELLPQNQQNDGQKFNVVGSLTSSNFFVDVIGLMQTGDLSTNNDPVVKWTLGSSTGTCTGSLSREKTDPNPYNCYTTAELNLPLHVDVAGYNRLESREESICGGTFNRPYLVCSKVDSVSLASGSNPTFTILPPTNFKKLNEATRVSLSANLVTNVTNVAKDDTLRVRFTANGEQAASFTCEANKPIFTEPTDCL